jgi:hypothetical protein
LKQAGRSAQQALQDAEQQVLHTCIISGFVEGVPPLQASLGDCLSATFHDRVIGEAVPSKAAHGIRFAIGSCVMYKCITRSALHWWML